MQDEDATQLFGDGFCKYLVALLQTVHFVLSFPTVQLALETTPIIYNYFYLLYNQNGITSKVYWHPLLI